MKATHLLHDLGHLHARAARPNLHIKIPGTKEGLLAIEEATFARIPVNVTLLFSREQYLAAADAWLRGVERRIPAGLDREVRSAQLQEEGAKSFVKSWNELLPRIAQKTAATGRAP